VGVLLGLLGLLLWGVGFVLRVLAPVIWPLAIAAVLAYLLDPVVDFLESKKVKRFWAIFLTFFLFVVLCLIALGSVVPAVVREARDMVENIPRYRDSVQKTIDQWLEHSPLRETLLWPRRFAHTNESQQVAQTNVVTTNAPAAPLIGPPPPHKPIWETEVGSTVLNWLGKVAPQVGTWVWNQASKVASWGGMLVGLSLVPVFTFYFLLEKQSIKEGWTSYLPVQESKFKDEAVFVISSINSYLIVFFRGQVLVALCDGVLFTIGFLAVGLPYAVLIGLLAGALSIVPYLGAILTIIPAVILALVQFHDWLHPILVVVVFGVVQTLEGFVISPKVMGDRVGLHPLTVIVSVLVGSLLLGGILGGILAIPLTAALRVLMFRYVWERQFKDPVVQSQ
jgi:predicted PurR-regulated permease PerM